MTDTNILRHKILIISDTFPRLDLAQRLEAVRHNVGGRIVLTSSFGIEDQVLADAIFTLQLEIDVVTLDTGRLFPETYRLWAETEQQYGWRIPALFPDHKVLEELVASQGADGFRSSLEARHACCATRKVEPLGRALAGAAAWITGLRADQSRDRASVPCASNAISS